MQVAAQSHVVLAVCWESKDLIYPKATCVLSVLMQQATCPPDGGFNTAS